MKILHILFLLLLIFSCYRNRIIESKYREKNPVESLKIDSSTGDVELIGWSENFIEIYTYKQVITGLPTDLNQMEIDFFVHEKEFNLVTKIPERINGEIGLKIFIPYTLNNININSRAGDMKIHRVLGNVEIKNIAGRIDVDFYGSILRINSNKSQLFLNVKSSNYSDVIINNEKGETDCNIESVGKDSFLDIISEEGNINFNISNHIPHEILVLNKSNAIKLNYRLIKTGVVDNSFLMGKTNLNSSLLNVYLSSEKGSIVLSEN